MTTGNAFSRTLSRVQWCTCNWHVVELDVVALLGVVLGRRDFLQSEAALGAVSHALVIGCHNHSRPSSLCGGDSRGEFDDRGEKHGLVGCGVEQVVADIADVLDHACGLSSVPIGGPDGGRGCRCRGWRGGGFRRAGFRKDCLERVWLVKAGTRSNREGQRVGHGLGGRRRVLVGGYRGGRGVGDGERRRVK